MFVMYDPVEKKYYNEYQHWQPDINDAKIYFKESHIKAFKTYHTYGPTHSENEFCMKNDEKIARIQAVEIEYEIRRKDGLK